jgi:ATP-dependent exoDNAse (exonuclease V) beta subunit
MAKETAKRFDEYQLAAIGADDTAIVSAGAGSGKTTVLSARYLRLVKERLFPIDSILALTFTKKATSEMFARIHGALAQEDSDFVKKQLENFGNARISTFDSFCARVSRSGCAAWGFSPDFAVDDGLALEMAEEEALAFVLDKREESVIKKFIVQHGFERVCREIFAKASLHMCPACPCDFASMPGILETFIREQLARARERLVGLRLSVLAADDKKAMAKYPPLFDREPPDSGSEDFLKYCESLAAIRCVSVNQPFHEESREIKDEICGPAVMAGRSLKALPEYAAVYALFSEYQERIVRAKRTANVLSFLDSNKMAKQVLISDPELRAFYKNRCKSIMVDEFQDDNHLQKEILYLLAEDPDRTAPSVPAPGEIMSGKLFFVGDEKQSIYRFRGADVSVFRRLGRELGPAAREIELAMNYRSEPRLIEFFNALFPAVMGEAGKDFEARYRPSGSRQAKEGVEPAILRLRYDPPETEEAGERGEPDEALDDKECEAWGIAQFIKDSAAGGRAPLMVSGDDGKPRPAAYDDFAVLFRTTTHQEKLERFLRLLALPFKSVDLCAFFREAPTNDLYLAMRCALYPGDRGALAAYLRSPFARLSDDAVADLLADPAFLDWRSLTPERSESLGDDDAVKAFQAAATLRAVSLMADRAPISAIVAYLWYEAGYREFLLARERNHAYLEYFDFLFSLADEADKAGSCLSAFIEDLERQIGDGERLRESDPPREEGRGVKLMTIHKAKGLEFPIVIVPGIEAAARDQDGKELIHWWREDCLTLKMSPDGTDAKNYFFKSCEDERKEMALAEQKRLLYVACTRAERHLVFTECVPPNKDNQGTSFRTILDRALEASAAGSMVELRPLPPRSRNEYLRLLGKANDANPPVARALEACRAASILDRPPQRRDFSATELNAAHAASLGLSFSREDGEPDAAADGGEGEGLFAGAVYGSVVHAIIQHELSGGGEKLELPSALAAALEGQSDPDAFLKDARKSAAAFLDSDLRKRLEAALWKRTEYPFLLRLEAKGSGEERFVSGVIDYIAVLDGECVIVDYKTNGQRAPGEYELQMSLYRQAARSLTGLPKVRSFLFYLRAGGAFEADAEIDPDPAFAALSGTSGLK